MATEKKITKREMYEAIKKVEGLTEEQVKFIDHELELLAKKNSAERKPTDQQKENMGIKEAILEYMVAGERYTVTEIIKGCEACKELTNQRVSALLRQMKTDLLIDKVEEKRKTYFYKIV